MLLCCFQKAARTGDSRVLKRELERWTAQGKSILLPTYVDACKTLARLESEERKAIEEAKAVSSVHVRGHKYIRHN